MSGKKRAILVGLVMGASSMIWAASPAMAATPPSCVGVRTTSDYYTVYVDNACSSTQKVRVLWGWLAANSACQTIPAATSRKVHTGNPLAQYSGIETC